MPAADHSPFGHAARYTPECYDGMRDDAARTSSYKAAILAAAPGKVVLDIGTGALALLAIFAAEAGATHVFAFEVQPAAAAAARRAVSAAGLADRVTIVEGASTEAKLPGGAVAQLLVHELIGEVAGEEGVVAAIVDATRRHTHPSAPLPLSVPSRASTLLAPCEFPDASYSERFPPALLAAEGSSCALKLPARLPPGCRLAAPQVFEDLRFDNGTLQPSQSAVLLFEFERDGRLAGLNMHVELRCAVDGADGPADVSSDWEGSHWRNILLRIGADAGVPVRAGQRLRVRTAAELAGPQPRYSFEAEVWERGERNDAGGVDEDGRWRAVGPRIEYPEAALNCNDMMDLLMQQMD